MNDEVTTSYRKTNKGMVTRSQGKRGTSSPIGSRRYIVNVRIRITDDEPHGRCSTFVLILHAWCMWALIAMERREWVDGPSMSLHTHTPYPVPIHV